jgi:hypothetical protein
MQTLVRPDYTSPQWEALNSELRAEVRCWLDAFATKPAKGVTQWLKQVAESMGSTYPTARRKYDDLRRSNDWTVLIDQRKANANSAARIDGTASPAFRASLLEIVESYQRKNTPAFRELRRRWVARQKSIPGYEDWAGWPELPIGWTNRNLARIVKAETNAARMRSIRVGTSSKTNPFLPTVRTTRVGLWPGAVIQLDDVWHDNYVSLGTGRNMEIVRVIELGALDLFSAHRFHWGAKPRRKRENGTWETIGGKEMRLFLAGMLHSNGYSPRGSMFMSEHNTAKVSEDIARILYDASHGLIRVDYQPIEGKQAALNGFWSGTEGGNFRAKAHLESIHNLIHNDLAHLPGQTGSPSSGLKGPVTTDRIISYMERVLRDVLKKVPHRADLLKLRGAGMPLDYHSQFIPYLVDYYQFGLAMRTDHDLEGWHELGHVISEYTTLPGSDQWLAPEQFLTLPEASRAIISQAANADPRKWIRRRNLSPLEVWNRRENFHQLPPVVLCDIIGRDLAREVTVDGQFVSFCDQDIAPDELIYTAKFVSGPNRGQRLHHGEKVLMFAMPFDERTALCIDAKGKFLGELPLYKKACPIDASAFGSTAPFEDRPSIRSQALKDAALEKHAAVAEIMQPSRILHADQVTEARDLREHNARVLSGAPVTPEEIHQARVAAGQQGTRTAAANRLQARAQATDWDTIQPLAATEPSAFDSLADDPDLPEAF